MGQGQEGQGVDRQEAEEELLPFPYVEQERGGDSGRRGRGRGLAYDQGRQLGAGIVKLICWWSFIRTVTSNIQINLRWR